MEAFLKEVAQKLIQEHPDDLREVTVVFNNHRSGLFLQKQFAQLTEGSMFLPNIIGINDLVSKLGKTRIIPNEFLLFELYNIYQEMGDGNERFDSFEKFIPFGEMMLSDFSEIDLYCADAKQILCNLSDLKKLGEWDIEGKPLTDFQKQYIRFYESLHTYYSKLRQCLTDKHTAYSGMAYREVAEHIDEMIDNHMPKAIYFVGFNALSESERLIIKAYVNRGVGHMLTDGDAYYYNDKAQEAGFFLNKHHADFAEIGDYEEHFAKGKKKINIIGCPENVLQTKYTAQLLNEKNTSGIPSEETAIVLADEGLLVPMLNSLPENIEAANVTMGFPFTQSEAHSLMLKLFSLYKRARNEKFYHQDILDVMADYFVSKRLGAKNTRSKLTYLLSHNKVIRASKDEIKQLMAKCGVEIEPVEFLLENSTPNPNEFIANARKLTIDLYDAEVAANNIKENEALACLLQTLDYFKDLQDEYNFVKNLNTLEKIYTRLAQRRSISFFGKPLSGLQILGVLETRNLDFRRVIMLSTNEGLLPSGRTNNSLIPMQLKVKADNPIPTYKDKDAVYAYHFYRFIQRAEEINLIYNTESDGMGKGEPSRFILQIKDELQKRYPDNIEINEITISAESANKNTAGSLVGKKTDSVMARLKQIADKGFSPSALNNYRGCPLKFYYENVLGAKDLDTMSDDLDQSDLGTCIHEVLEGIYRIDPKGKVRVETLRNELEKLPQTIKDKFSKLFLNGAPDEGKNRLLQSVAETQLTNFLKKEIKRLESGDTIVVVDVEREMNHPIDITFGEGEKKQVLTVNVGGKADRIDKYTHKQTRECELRMIDYKSGGVDEKDLKKSSTIPDKLFQVMTYSWLFGQEDDAQWPITPGIMPLRMLNTDFMPAEWGGHTQITKDDVTNFEAELKKVLAEIMNPQMDFEPDHKSRSCDFCPMKALCK